MIKVLGNILVSSFIIDINYFVFNVKIATASDGSSFKRKTVQRITESDSYFESWKRIVNAKVGFRRLYGYTTILKLVSYFIFLHIPVLRNNVWERGYKYGLHYIYCTRIQIVAVLHKHILFCWLWAYLMTVIPETGYAH
jgi:hypothetical protein